MVQPNPFTTKLERQFAISDDAKRAVEHAATKVYNVEHRRDLLRKGDAPDHLHVIQSGFACRYKTVVSGQRAIVGYLIPGDICDLNVSILGSMDHSIRTLSPCAVMRIPRADIAHLSARDPTFDRALRWYGAIDEAISREWLINIGFRAAEERVAHLLCEMLVRFEAVDLAADRSYHFPVTQADIGATLGLSNVHVNRVLQSLRTKKLLVFKERMIKVLDVEALKYLADFGPDYLRSGIQL